MQFFVNGVVFASFVPRYPEIRDRVDITVGGLGRILLLAGVIGFVGTAFVGPAIDRFGTRRVMIVTAVGLALSLPIVGFATTPWVLLVGLGLMSALDAPVDVAMNLQGSWLSARRHAPVMNRLHGLWSLGTVVGGLGASLLADAGVSLRVHLVAASVVLLAAIGFVGVGLLPVDEHPTTTDHSSGPPKRRRSRSGVLVVFAFAGFFSVAIEFTSSDWAAFRFTDDFGTAAGIAALGYVAVTTGMTIGRFSGDWLVLRLGSDHLLRLSIVVSGVGLTMATLVDQPVVSIAGFVLAGLGNATLIPKIYDEAAKYPGQAGVGLAALTAGIRISVLLTPLVVGSLADTSLSVGSAMAAVALPSVVGVFLASGGMSRAKSRRTTPEPPQ